MKILFTMDEKNYTADMPKCMRYAVRAIICRNGKYAMQKSRQGDFKMPGGGIECDETHIEALQREVGEELGLCVDPDSVKELGEVIEKRVDRFDHEKAFECHTFYYFCDVTEENREVKMTESELRLGYHPSWEELGKILQANESRLDDYWQKRDFRVLQELYNLHI